MTIQDIARSEEISERQAQRYCRAPGYKGHVLKATRRGKGFLIQESDYRAWRLECGFDFLPQPDAASEKTTPAKPVPKPVRACPCSAILSALPAGSGPERTTNECTRPTSRNWPHPLACEAYMQEQARKMKSRLRGYDDEN